MPPSLVVLLQAQKSKEVCNLTSIGCHRIKVEPLKRKNSSAQFYNCQEFYYHSRFCWRNLRYLEYAGSHKSNTWPKPREAPVACCHCGGNHTDNFTGCPKITANRKTCSSNRLARPRNNSQNKISQCSFRTSRKYRNAVHSKTCSKRNPSLSY
ncbi:hypothetical protein AVEN_120565-1 [Araneus ventricosus]|uniref:Uncharacterized protein n=1 Tax=Araneus ventricosus TaxID=182803 RepID=A0A4Y2H9I9_ARAVE|nr:hypothetical protein AVEN_120565-1 [Araneus ventricosus]